jgi:hypothetical protein
MANANLLNVIHVNAVLQNVILLDVIPNARYIDIRLLRLELINQILFPAFHADETAIITKMLAEKTRAVFIALYFLVTYEWAQ